VTKINWRQIKGRLKRKWDNLTHNDRTAKLADLLQQKLGYSKGQAVEASDKFPHGLNPVTISNSSRRLR
jgi:uncharacterized protein YjbJ (UPF0337 family)